tara:strand:+ start:1241 stop:1489 length:249 start_codon:yes stop_codon:yes gene_type:complete
LYRRNPNVPQTIGANNSGMSVVACVAAMIERPRKPRMQPIVDAVENSLLMLVIVLSMPYTSSKRVYYAMFSGVPKVVYFWKK